MKNIIIFCILSLSIGLYAQEPPQERETIEEEIMRGPTPPDPPSKGLYDISYQGRMYYAVRVEHIGPGRLIGQDFINVCYSMFGVRVKIYNSHGRLIHPTEEAKIEGYLIYAVPH